MTDILAADLTAGALEALRHLSWAEVCGSITGLISVWLTVRNNIWCWAFGIASVLLYTLVFFDARLYADMLLQLVFCGMNCYGWYMWRNAGKSDEFSKQNSASSSGTESQRRIRVIPRDELFASLVAVVVASIGVSIALKQYTNAVVPELDAFLTSLSLAAVWMQARKYRESWLLWLSADVLYVGLFVNRRLWMTAALYAVFCGMAYLGWREWARLAKAEHTDGKQASQA